MVVHYSILLNKLSEGHGHSTSRLFLNQMTKLLLMNYFCNLCVFLYGKGFHVKLLYEIISFWGYKRHTDTKSFC